MIGDRADLALALHADGALAYMRGDWTGCWQRAEEARAAAPGVDDVEASTVFLQAMVLLGRDDLRRRDACRSSRRARPWLRCRSRGGLSSPR